MGAATSLFWFKAAIKAAQQCEKMEKGSDVAVLPYTSAGAREELQNPIPRCFWDQTWAPRAAGLKEKLCLKYRLPIFKFWTLLLLYSLFVKVGILQLKMMWTALQRRK